MGAATHRPIGRGRRAIAASAKALGLAAVFGLAAGGGALLHRGLRAPRAFLLAQVNAVLDGPFAGKIVIHRAGVLHFDHLDGIEAEVDDPEGRRVVYATGIQARFGAWPILRSLVGGPHIIVPITGLDVETVAVVLEDDASGRTGLERAFDFRVADTGTPSRGVELAIDHIHVEALTIRGHLASAPNIDVHLGDLRGSVASTPDATTLDISHLDVSARDLVGFNPDGTLVAHAVLPSSATSPTRANAHYEGRLNGIDMVAEGSIDGKRVAASLDVSKADPRAIESAFSDTVHLGAPLSLHAEARGVLPTITGSAVAQLGRGAVHADTTLVLSEGSENGLTARVAVNVDALDTHLVDPSAPVSHLTARLDATVALAPHGKLSGHFRLSGEPGSVSDQVVPASVIEGDFTEDSVRGHADLAEIGAPSKVTFDLHPAAGRATPTVLAFTTHTDVANLNAIARLGPIGRGRARIDTSGQLDLAHRQIDAKVKVDGSSLDVRGVRMGRLVLTGNTSGPLGNPRFDATVNAAPLLFAGYGFTALTVAAHGSAAEIDAHAQAVGDDHSPTLDAAAHIQLGAAIAITKLRASVERGGVTAKAAVASTTIKGSHVDVRGVVIDGLGESVFAAARIGGGRYAIQSSAVDIDLAKLLVLAGRDDALRGHLGFDIDLAATRDEARGHVTANIDGLTFGQVSDASARIAASFDDRHVHGTVSASLEKAGSFAIVTSDADLLGPLTQPKTWMEASGSADVHGEMDLGLLSQHWPLAARPLAYASGNVAFHATAERRKHTGDPDVTLSVATRDLRVVGGLSLITAKDGSMALGPTPWTIRGIDGDVGATLAGTSGHTDVTAKLHDVHGPLISMDASADLPVDALLRDTEHAVARLEELPVSLGFVVPRRSIQELPEALGTIPARGDVEMSGRFDGTLRAPKASASLSIAHLEPEKTSACGHAVSLDTTVAYDGKVASFTLVASTNRARSIDARGRLTFDLAQLLDGHLADWEADGKLALTHFPLPVLGAFVGEPIGGTLDGTVSVDRLHRDASLRGSVAVSGLSFSKGLFPNGKVEVTAEQGKFDATARLDQSDGYAAIGAKAALTWGASLVPALDLSQPIDVTIAAKNFSAGVAKPFVAAMVTDIGGRVDADMKLHVMAGGKDGNANGEIVLRDGIVDLPEIGERFHDIEGHLIMKPWGTVRLERFSAKAHTGSLKASAEARMSGLSFVDASAKLSIKKGESIPVTIEGVSMGRAYGDVTAKAAMVNGGKRLDIHVDVPLLRVDLPQATGHSVQRLDDDAHVAIGLSGSAAFQTLALGPPPKERSSSAMAVRATVNLGREVEVRRDTSLDVFAQGQTVIEIGDKTHLTGQIRLLRGKLELQGKMFTIERGVISFVGDDPANPMVIATAYWNAPGGTRVIADFSGFVSSGKLELRSEPALSQDEILALVLFGSADGSFGASAPPGQGESTAVQGVGIAGGVFTQGLNKIIAGVTTADISTRIDSSEANSPRPEVGVQITKTISARLGYKLGVPTPGDNPDRAQLTVDWRFIRNWSLSTEVGDQGSTALDIVWRKRY